MAYSLPAMLCLLAVLAPLTVDARGSLVSVSESHQLAVEDNEFGANPIRRVVNMLQSMAKKVEAEGKKEEELYDKFQCYCKNGEADLTASISGSNTKVPQLQSDIEEAESKVKQLKQDLKSHQEDRASSKAAMATATAQREEEHAKFLEVSGEYKSYISALSGAIPAIEKGMSGGFLQTKAGAVLRQAVTSDTTITDYDRQLVLSFLSGGAAASEEYVPKSGEIIGILKGLKDDFDKALEEVTTEEEGAVKIYEELMAAKTKQVHALTESIEKKTALSGETAVEIVNMKNDLSETEKTLIADKKFLADLEGSCEGKAKEFEERTKTRAEELVAIHETIKILNDDDALDLFKKTLPSASLLQVRANGEQRRHQALALVRKAQKIAPKAPSVDFLALALSGKKLDFSKVFKMIDNLIARLKTAQIDDDCKLE
jgi:chromosome segregation ATPase